MKLLFGTDDYQYLADELLKEEENEFVKGDLTRISFSDGERYMKVNHHVKGAHCVILSGTNTDANTLDIFDLGTSLVNAGAKRLTIIIPYFGYSTMEKGYDGEVIKAKTRADLISAIPKASYGNEVVLLEPHNDAMAYYFNNITVRHISSKTVIMKACVELAGTNFVLATTDVGRAKAIEYIQRAFTQKHRSYNIDTAFAYKRRDTGTNTEITGINADVKERIVVIYDDMIRTGGSLMQAAHTYKKHGASKIFAIATHGVLPGSSLETIKNAKVLEKLALTNSHPNAVKLASDPFVRMYSIAGLLTKC